MKRKLAWMMLLAMLAACLNVGAALGMVREEAVVDGRTSDRVHLRAEPSQDAVSLGLYFSGTAVACLSNPDEEWVEVAIGSETGYIMSKFLHRKAQPGHAVNRQPKGVVRSSVYGGKVNLRTSPTTNSEVATTLRRRESVTVLGETDSLWYLVQANGFEGYIRADLLSLADAGYAAPEGSHGKAVIDGRSSDRVHLRADNYEGAASMGLYFTGTIVSCHNDPKDVWVKVTIGTETGYIMGKYLVSGDRIHDVDPLQPTGVVHTPSGSNVNLRTGPSRQANIAKALADGKSVTILGETHSQWYCVRTGGVIGYIEADYLRDVGCATDRRD